MQRDTRMLIVGALIAVAAQVLVAPNIAIFQVTPNFIIVYGIVASMLMPGNAVLACSFLLGLASDLLGYGPVGALSFLLTLASFAAGRMHATLSNSTVGGPLLIMAVLAILVDVLYAAFLLGLTPAASVAGAFVYRALPCALYDCVVGLLVYPIMARMGAGAQPKMKSVTPEKLR